MPEFFSSQFTWQTFFGELLWGVLLSWGIWSLVLTAVARGLAWLFGMQLDSFKRNLAFCGLMFISIFLVLSFVALNQVIGHQRSAPELKGQIDWTAIGSQAFSPNPPITITLIASIRNLGMPSIVERWSLSVILPSGRTFPTRHVRVPEELPLQREGASPIIIYGVDALYDKTESTPIMTGGMQRGVLLFTLEGVDLHTISQPDTKLLLSYQDVLGKVYSTEKELGSQLREPLYFPGIRSFQ
jgi:hypothetical protein